MARGIERKYYVFAFRAFADITATVLVPAVAMLILRSVAGLGTTAFFLLLAAALLGTMVVLFRKIKRYGSAYQQLIANAPRRGGAGS